jgi:hypothetical protein
MGRKLTICFLAAILTPCAFGADEAPAFGISVKLADHYNPDFKVCTLIRVGAPFQIDWTNGTAKSQLSVLLRTAKNDIHPVVFSLEESIGEGTSAAIKTELDLKLEKPEELMNIESSLFHHFNKASVLLTKKDCQ